MHGIRARAEEGRRAVGRREQLLRIRVTEEEAEQRTQDHRAAQRLPGPARAPHRQAQRAAEQGGKEVCPPATSTTTSHEGYHG